MNRQDNLLERKEFTCVPPNAQVATRILFTAHTKSVAKSKELQNQMVKASQAAIFLKKKDLHVLKSTSSMNTKTSWLPALRHEAWHALASLHRTKENPLGG